MARTLASDPRPDRLEIQEEVTKKLVSKSYHEAIEQKQLKVASLADIEDVQFGDDRSMRFRATVVTTPEFEVPEYKKISVELPETKVSEAEIDAALDPSTIAQPVRLAPSKPARF